MGALADALGDIGKRGTYAALLAALDDEDRAAIEACMADPLVSLVELKEQVEAARPDLPVLSIGTWQYHARDRRKR